MKNDSTVVSGLPFEATASGRSRFPDDLRAWLKGRALLRLANGIAQEHTVSALQPVFSMRSKRFHHPWRMLTLLTYSLASGVWDPRTLAEMAACDADLVVLFNGETPSAEVIRRFRNDNRLPILRCLEQLLRRLWCHEHDQRVTALPPLLTVEILCDARSRLQRAERRDRAGGTEPGMNFQGG